MKKHRQCPHCKSKKGFTINVSLGGYQTVVLDFNGKIISVDRFGSDDIERCGQCLECKKNIDIEKLDIYNV